MVKKLKIFILILFFQMFLFTNIFSIEDITVLKFDYYAHTEYKNYYDNYLKNDFLFKNSFFELKNRTFLGYSDEFKYIVNSVYGEIRLSPFMAGYKTSYNDSNKLGSFDKFIYPKLKEEDDIFLIDTLKYRDIFTVKKNQFALHEYIPVDVIYFNVNRFGLDLNYVTSKADPENIDPEGNFQKLEFFEDYIASVSFNYNGFKNGLMFMSGKNNDYYYKEIKNEDLNRNNDLFDDQIKDLIIYAFSKDRFYFNFGIYDYEKAHFVSVKYIFNLGDKEYFFIADANILNNTITLYLTVDYDFKTYLHFSDSWEKDYFAAVSKIIRIGRLNTNLMTGYRDIFYQGKNYSGWYSNWRIEYPSDFGLFYCSFGNYVFNDLWNSWFIYPEKNNFMFHFGFRKEIKW